MRKQLTPEQIEEVFRKLSLIFEFADFSPAVLERAVNMLFKVKQRNLSMPTTLLREISKISPKAG